MEYSELVEYYEDLEATSSNLEKTSILASLYSEADEELLPKLVNLSRGKVYSSWESEEFGVSSQLTLKAISKATGLSEQGIEEEWRETGDLGNAAKSAVEEKTQQTLFSDTLDVVTVYDSLRELATYEGEGSEQKRIDNLARLLTAADPDEARYIVRSVVGAMRLGVGEGTVRDAIAEAFLDGSDEAIEAVERAHQVTNDFQLVAETAKVRGMEGLEELDVELFRPIKVMLAQKAESAEDALDRTATEKNRALMEYKYDGVRIQAHKDGADIRVFTRRLEEITEQFPDVVEVIEQHVQAGSCILEGEIVPFDPDSHSMKPFQQLSQRIKRKYNIEDMIDEIPVVTYLFDIISYNGRTLLDDPLHRRLSALEECLQPEEWVIERARYNYAEDAAGIDSFYEESVAGGHEGLMVKNLAAPYQPGSRVGYMMKLKPVMESLDLVIPRAKWSEGRKSDWLGRPFLACRDSDSGEFLEVGRMHSGFTDEELQEITDRLEPLIRETNGREVTLDPEVVIEVEYEEIQESPKYESGYALRFPRFKQFRDDLAPRDVDTLSRIQDLYDTQ